MRIGIVGSRDRTDKQSVVKVVEALPKTDTIVSGGCQGVDTWAEETAKRLGMKTSIFKPDLKDITSRTDMINRYYQRNKKIVENSDLIIAFPNTKRKGGTENTIKWAKKLSVRYIIKTTEKKQNG